MGTKEVVQQVEHTHLPMKGKQEVPSEEKVLHILLVHQGKSVVRTTKDLLGTQVQWKVVVGLNKMVHILHG